MRTGRETLYVRANPTTTPAVDTPSATWLLLARISASASPLPSLTPTDLQKPKQKPCPCLSCERWPENRSLCISWIYAYGLWAQPGSEGARSPVARERAIAGEHDVAKARQARHCGRLGAHLLCQPPDLCTPLGNQSRHGIVTQVQALHNTCVVRSKPMMSSPGNHTHTCLM